MVSALRLASDPVAVSSDVIARVEDVMGGRPVIRGTRITVEAVKGRISGGDTIDDLTVEYPGVARQAFEAALAYDLRPAAAHPAVVTRRDG